MRNLLTLALLGPILLLQGRHVRKTTPKLPEANGSRSGVRGKGPVLRLLITGDSAAAGVGVSRQDEALSGQLIKALASRYEVHWRLIAKSGATTESLMALLHSSEIEPFDVAVVSIGVNDVTKGIPEHRWIEQQKRLRSLLMQRFAVRQVFFTSIPPMHRFPALPQPLRWYLGRGTKKFNDRLGEWTERDAHVTLVKVDFPLDSEHMASDGFHPGKPAYQLWARVMAHTIWTAHVRSALG